MIQVRDKKTETTYSCDSVSDAVEVAMRAAQSEMTGPRVARLTEFFRRAARRRGVYYWTPRSTEKARIEVDFMLWRG